MRRKDREISREEGLQILEKAEYGVLSLSTEEGPYGVPLSFVLMDGKIYFHCAKMGRKIDALAADDRVSFCAVGDVKAAYDGDFTTYFESVIVSGRARHVERSGEVSVALLALCYKYLPDHVNNAAAAIEKSGNFTAVYSVDIESISAKAKRP